MNKLISNPYFIIIICCFCLVNCKFRRYLDAKAIDEVAILKSGALLMRLNGTSNKADYFTKRGEIEKAQQLVHKNKKEHEKIMQTFHNEYRFSDVYFFHAKDALLIKDQNFKEVVFLNTEGASVSHNEFIDKGYFIAAFDRVYDAQTNSGDHNQKEIKTSNSSMPALVVFDSNFVQLQRPFPYKIILDPRQERKYKTIKELNQLLFAFDRWHGRRH